MTRTRRTQAERRATTQAALLESCVDCLLEYGYTGLTTAQVVRRAGVSRGAQAHHFSTKAELVVAALRHLGDRLASDVNAERSGVRGSTAEAQRALLDRLWAVHTDRVFPALMELWVAARTDLELRPIVAELERDFTHKIIGFCQQSLPEIAGHPNFRSLLSTSLAAIRGLAMLEFLDRGEEVAKMWPGMRAQLESMFAGTVPSSPDGAARS